MLALSLAAMLVAAPTLDTKLLDKEIGALSAKVAPGRLGVAVVDLGSGKRWSLRGDERFPLQSVFKVFAGALLLQKVDAGAYKLDASIVVPERMLSVYWSPLAESFRPPESTYPLTELVSLAVSVSDNTAGDLILRLGGGPKAMNALFAKAGIKGVRVDRYEREIQPQFSGLEPFGPDEVINRAKFVEDVNAVPEARAKAALQAYLEDVRDTSTPNGAADFIAALRDGKLLEPETTTFLLTCMANTQTGENRVKAGLPKNVTWAHKTGTGGRVFGVNSAVNDIGMITLPSGRRVILAVFLSNMRATEDAAEAVHADVARLVVKAVR